MSQHPKEVAQEKINYFTKRQEMLEEVLRWVNEDTWDEGLNNRRLIEKELKRIKRQIQIEQLIIEWYYHKEYGE